MLQIGLEFYLQAFFELHSERASGMIMMPIPWRSLRDYAEHYCLSGDEMEDFIFLLRQMDEAYLAKVNKYGDTTGSVKKNK